MEKVKALMAEGATLSEAVQIVLGRDKRSLSQVALDRGFSRQGFTGALNGISSPTPAHVAALVAELGGEPAEWLDLLAEAAAKRIRAVAV